jgi:type VI secretion system secreted protein VgrG
VSKKFTQQGFWLKVKSPLGEDDLILRSFQGEDRVSGLFHYTLEMLSEKPDLDLTAVVGQPVTVVIGGDSGEKYINGVCSRFVQAGTNQRFTTYYAELRPWLWMLTLGTNSRIYQQKSVTDIIKAVFDDKGFSDVKLQCQGTHNPRDYCVQYQETDFDFVSRLMEDEGIFYWFEHEDGKHTMVMADDVSAFQPIDGLDPVRVKLGDSVGGGEDVITALALEQQVTVGGYAMTDYDFEAPSSDLKTKVDGEAPARQVFEYPGGYKVKGDGEGRVKLRIEAHELEGKLVKGQSGVRAFRSGAKITVAEHVRDDLNADYVLRWVSHSASGFRYSNSFEAFPADKPFRPPVTTRKPRIGGAQTAVVVGKSGEEIFTDQYGRIKVKFFWDRLGTPDDKASCWIRVSQGWAGKGWGAFFLPRIGQEVIVTFLDGDPDRPVVTGAVYNAEQVVPYSLPGDSTKSTVKTNSSKGGGGFNELRFEDKKDAEEIYLQAQKDMKVLVKHDLTWNTGHDEVITIKNSRKTTVQESDETLIVEKGNRTVKVSKGNEDHAVKGNRTVKVEGNTTHKTKGNWVQNVDGNYTLKVKGNLTIDVTGTVTIKSAQSVTAKSGTAFTIDGGTDVTAKAGMNMKLKAGMNLEGEGGIKAAMKGGAMGSFEAGGMLSLKGGIVKIN